MTLSFRNLPIRVNYSERAQAKNRTSITSPTGIKSPSFFFPTSSRSTITSPKIHNDRFKHIPHLAPPPPPADNPITIARRKRKPVPLKHVNVAKDPKSATYPRTPMCTKKPGSPRKPATPRTPRLLTPKTAEKNLVPVFKSPAKKKVVFDVTRDPKEGVRKPVRSLRSLYPWSKSKMLEDEVIEGLEMEMGKEEEDGGDELKKKLIYGKVRALRSRRMK